MKKIVQLWEALRGSFIRMSLRRKILAVIFSGITMTIGAGTLIESCIIRHEFSASIEKSIHQAFRFNLDRINDVTKSMENNGYSVALTGEMLHESSKGRPPVVLKKLLARFLRDKVGRMPMILGSGIWYEPYRTLPGEKYCGPYGYWRNGSVHVTWEYSVPEYNYVSRYWYTIAKPARPRSGDTVPDQKVYITPPYYDTLEGRKIVFITMAVPMFDSAGRFLGVSSTDWGIDVIYKNLTGFSPTENSFVILADGTEDRILYHPDKRMVMKKLSDLPWYRDFRSDDFRQYRITEKKGVLINGISYDLLSTGTDAGFRLIMGVPPEEAYSRVVMVMWMFYISSSFLIILIIITLSKIFDTYFIRRVIEINNSISEIEKGNYGSVILFKGTDELSHIAENINTMSRTILHREKQLLGLQRYLANIIESMPSVLVAFDFSGVITQWNRAAAETFGIAHDEALGENLWNMLPDLVRFKDDVEKALKTRVAVFLSRELFLEENARYYNIHIFPLIADGEQGCVLHLVDITEIEKKDEQLRQAQKLEIIGTLAGGLAHDFNNILSGIMGTTSLLTYHLEHDDDIDNDMVAASVKIINESSRRAAAVVQQLLVLSRKQETVCVPIDLNDVVKRVVAICSNTFEKSVEIRAAYSEQAAMVKADVSQIEQVLFNLCINGYHAMTFMRGADKEAGGILRLALEKITAGPDLAQAYPEAEQGTAYWKISVSDEGVGISGEQMKQIFDPFYTTKEKDSGTGLGLTMVDNIIHHHGGFIEVRSAPGSGSTFSVFLASLEDGGAVSESVKTELKRGEGVVLVIDDEHNVRKITGTMLELCGYSVLQAENGPQGIALFSENPEKIDAVILDLDMPKLSGREVFMELKKIRSDVRVLLTSGFLKDKRIADLLEMGVRHYLQKPYGVQELSEIIWNVIHDE